MHFPRRPKWGWIHRRRRPAMVRCFGHGVGGIRKKDAEEIFVCPTQMDVHGLSVFVDLDLLWGEALAKQTAAIRSDLGNEWAQKKESKPQIPIGSNRGFLKLAPNPRFRY